MTRDEMLERLQPPAMPLEPGLWPPAAIWWILLSIIICIAIGWLIWRRHQHINRQFYQARRSLDQISQEFQENGNASQLLQQLAYWLRQVSRITEPGSESANLRGTAWLVFLDRDLPQPDFSRGPGIIFADLIYQANAEFDSNAVLALCYRWLECSHKRLRQ